MDKTIAKGMSVIEFLARREEPQSLGEIAEALGLGKSNVHRTLRTLVELGYVRQAGGKGNYALTTKLWEVGVGVMSKLNFVQLSRPHLVRLREETGESTLISIVDGNEAIYVDRVMSNHAITVVNPIGARVPAWCNASGRVILAFTVEDAGLIEGPFPAYTPKTIHTRAALAKEFARIRASGYSMTREEWHPGVYGLAAPIRDHRGVVVASIGVTGPTARLTPAMTEELRDRVIARAAAISGELGLRTG